MIKDGKMKNIIFLDIDGVFNCQIYYKSKQFLDYRENPKAEDEKVKRLDYYASQICKERMGWFNQLCEETDSEVVISSTWRSSGSVEVLQEMMNYCGATFKIIGKTPHTGYERGTEISKWLKDNITPETYGCHYFDFYRYAIIDDDSDMLLNQESHFFKTDNFSGLTPNTCYKIKRFFLHKTF